MTLKSELGATTANWKPVLLYDETGKVERAGLVFRYGRQQCQKPAMSCQSKLGNQDHKAVTHDSRDWIVIPPTVSETALFVFHAMSLRLTAAAAACAFLPSLHSRPTRWRLADTMRAALRKT